MEKRLQDAGSLGNVEEGRDIVAAVMKGLREEEFLINRMIRLQASDDYTVALSLNVCVMVVAQAASCGSMTCIENQDLFG